MSMFNRKQERDGAAAQGKADAKAARAANRKPKEPKLHELAPNQMAGALVIGTPFDSAFHGKALTGKDTKVKAIQVTGKVWPGAISFPTADMATTGVAVVKAIAEKVGPGRKGYGYKAVEVQDLLLDLSRSFSDGEGHQLVMQVWPPSLTIIVGQDMAEFTKGATAYLAELAAGIESGDKATLEHMETLRAEGGERKEAADKRREEKKAAKLKAEAEAAVAAKAAK